MISPKLRKILTFSAAVLGLATIGTTASASNVHHATSHASYGSGLVLTNKTDPLSRASILYQGYLKEHPTAQYTPVTSAHPGKYYTNYLSGRYGVWKTPKGRTANDAVATGKAKTYLAGNYIPFRVLKQDESQHYDKITSRTPHVTGWVNRNGIYHFGTRSKVLKAVKAFNKTYAKEMKQNQARAKHTKSDTRLGHHHSLYRHVAKRPLLRKHHHSHALKEHRYNHKTSMRKEERRALHSRKGRRALARKLAERAEKRTHRTHKARRAHLHKHLRKHAHKVAKRAYKHATKKHAKTISHSKFHVISKRTYDRVAAETANHHGKKLTAHKEAFANHQKYILVYYGAKKLGWVNAKLVTAE